MFKIKTIFGKKPKKDNFNSLPDEMVIRTLSFVSVDSLLDCRLVCSRWRALIDSHALQEKASRENETVNYGRGFYSFSKIDAITVKKLDFPWYVFYAVIKYDPFNRNLVKNHCGQDVLKYWKHDDACIIEQPPSPAVPDHPDFDGVKSCFVCQFLKFKNYGLTKAVMESLQPDVLVSVWNPTSIRSEFYFQATIHDGQNNLINHQICNEWGPPNFYSKLPLLFKNQAIGSTLILSYNSFQDLSNNYIVSGFLVKVSLPIQLKSSEYKI